MSRHHAQVTVLSDIDAGAFLLASGLRLLRIEAEHERGLFVFLDKQAQARGLRADYGEGAALSVKLVFRCRRQLLRGLRLARESPARCCTASDLAAFWSRVDDRRRRSVAA